ncbi:MAG: FliA/WhiG family RNA polymerase sigma factor [Vulcanimicrobiaceae bacterium]
MRSSERDASIEELYPIVRAIARRVARATKGADADDLAGDGALGLIRAVDTFDPGRGTTLETYARRLILGAMLNGLRRSDPVSERVRRTLRRAEERLYRMAQERGTLPSFIELERVDAGIRRARVAAYRYAPLSLDAPLGRERDPLVDWNSEPSARAVERAKRAALFEAVALLPERQRRIVSMHYASELSLHAIGTRLRVSPQRVSQLHRGALTRLRSLVPGV